MSDMIFHINPNGSSKKGAISDKVKAKTKNCKRPGGFLWGARGLSCSCK
ncbi:hypothetical protein C672_0235 [[Clostridium] bifermentans ATCC 638]|uniref:Uncharacterized protein n=1 Tax=Paraclostridium bifermentans ATCC 638 = DSM 14991 TaxID=1233171 RepID=T4VVP4_PARBF|nr:hypothetical protein [Paraclostridium bifermentans]EQK45508.1 hypothetical protein C672_0235 [[Clostridium] bifermentans ATCC 638] [Paraclostridium bifermentans ATCC 638 = DSM 14991]UAG18029.1 hypothetical protein KXZ80_14890 [Paraclostridium bifermentans]